MSETRDLEEAVASLVPRAQRGDADALERLLRRCRNVVYRWALVETGDAADAEDVTQEVLIRLHGSLHRYAGRSRFTTWLFRVTRNESVSLRRRIRSRLRLAEAKRRDLPEDDRAQEDPLARVHASRVADLVAVLLEQLPRREREVFCLSDIEGCTSQEISQRMGMSPVTARVHLLHARRALRSRILERWPELAEEA